MRRMSLADALRLGMQHHQAGRLGDAEHVYRAMLETNPQNADALHLLGVIAQQRRQNEQAIVLFRRAINARPDAAEFWHNLGNSLLSLSRREEAADAFAAAVKLDPKLFEAQHNLGAALMLCGRSNEAAEAFAVAVSLNPASPEAHNNFGLALKDQGDLDAAIEQFTQATNLRPDYHHAHSNRLYAMHFHPSLDAAAIFAAHCAWAEQYADPLAAEARAHAVDRSLDRKLRIGYLSPDLRDHPVGRSVLPLVEHHDPDRFDVICYFDSSAGDDISRRLRQATTEWHETARLADAQLADLVRQHRIDILVDLTLHMHRNRLPVFARKTAPVQATFLGYPATTGLRQIDFRITDRWLDPPGDTQAVNSEQLICLPRSFWCYVPDESSPAAGELPLHRNGFVTFGSLNNPCKMNDEVIDTWAEILHSVPGSKLTLNVIEQNRRGDRFRDLFAKREIDPARLQFVSLPQRLGYLRQWNEIDIALDPFPYNGHMTSCDALWMGVPVVSLRGETSVGRGGQSLLESLDLTELLALTKKDYIPIAAALAVDVPRLSSLRSTLRQRMLDSPLTDARGFARDVQACYRSMWIKSQA